MERIVNSILTIIFIFACALWVDASAKVYCAPEKVEDIQGLTVNDRIFQDLPTLRPTYSATSKEMYSRPMCEYNAVPMLDENNDPVLDENNEPIVNQVVNNSPCCEGQACNVNTYYFDDLVDENDNRSYYDRLVIDSKPLLSEFQSLLDSYKASKIADINFENKVCEMQSDFRQLAKKCGYERANITKLMHEIIDNKDQVKKTCLESKVSELASEKARNERIQEKKRLGALADSISKDVYNLIAGYNLDRNLTTEQINQMESTFSPIMQALQAKRPKKAKGLINSIQPDGNLITQEMKDDVLYLLKDL